MMITQMSEPIVQWLVARVQRLLVYYARKLSRDPVHKYMKSVFWTHKMIQDNPGLPQDPLFLIHTPAIKLALSANQLIYRLRKWLKLIGEDDMAFSLHSLHRGGATFAYQSDLEGEMIKLLGGWASNCYKRYIDVSIDKKYEWMKAFVEALNRLTVEQ